MAMFCALFGHRWDPWFPVNGTRMQRSLSAFLEVRYCRRCHMPDQLRIVDPSEGVASWNV